jgi:hypothetical protein
MPRCKLPKTWFKDVKVCPHGYGEERTENPKAEWCSGCEFYEECDGEEKTWREK